MRTSLVGVMALSILCAAPLACGGDDDEATDDATDGGDMDDMAAESCSSDMFDKYGLEAFSAVNDSIIEKSVAAPTSALGTSFQALAAQGEDRVAEFRTNLANFLVMVYGGPDNYDGPDMRAAHAGLNITSEQYDFFITDVVVPALAENGVPTADIEDCFAPPVVDADFKNSIINQ
jgi:Bacterial-like globin